MKERKFLGSLAKFWRAVRERKLLIYRVFGVLGTLLYALCIWCILFTLMLILEKVTIVMNYLDVKIFHEIGMWIIVIIAAATGGYRLNNNLSWAKEKAEIKDFDFDCEAFALGMTILSVVFLVIFIAGVYQLCSLIISL